MQYDSALVDAIPDAAVESFAGVGSPFILRNLDSGERVVDIGSGGGFDCFYVPVQTGPTGQIIGIDMTDEMLTKSRATARAMGLDHVEFKDGLIEAMPVDDNAVDVVISNGVINLCPDKEQVFGKIFQVLKPGGRVLNRRGKMSTYGRLELPVAFRVKAGGQCLRKLVSSTSS